MALLWLVASLLAVPRTSLAQLASDVTYTEVDGVKNMDMIFIPVYTAQSSQAEQRAFQERIKKVIKVMVKDANKAFKKKARTAAQIVAHTTPAYELNYDHRDQNTCWHRALYEIAPTARLAASQLGGYDVVNGFDNWIVVAQCDLVATGTAVATCSKGVVVAPSYVESASAAVNTANRDNNAELLVHELGHSLCADHASTERAGGLRGTVPFVPSGSGLDEYGDSLSYMGNWDNFKDLFFRLPSIQTPHGFGWIPDDKVLEIDLHASSTLCRPSCTHTLQAVDGKKPLAADPSIVVGLRLVTRISQTNFYVEFRDKPTRRTYLEWRAREETNVVLTDCDPDNTADRDAYGIATGASCTVYLGDRADYLDYPLTVTMDRTYRGDGKVRLAAVTLTPGF
eukprot:CAMPEP_0197400336 /NCGR_PEP_ID=MMETSP1165-20131217/16721_1 /TAXON_ID=284809 /ORGANISM="Chrysocystis fragilis, Strain CCMP3189" /LENGTH=396 /DNA_ID=CAMNT_0042926395 /DNA_START=1 /DNA_END=1191 /DNA_ORIENTATION=+